LKLIWYESDVLEKEDGIAFSEAIAKLSGLLKAVLELQVGEDDHEKGQEGEDTAMEREVELVRLQWE